MALARYESVAVNRSGDVIPNATVEVRRDQPGRPVVPLFSDREGAVPLGNPITTDSEGKFGFHVPGGVYYIRVFTGPSQQPLQQYVRRYQAIGTAAERDIEDMASALEAGTATFPTLPELEAFVPAVDGVGGKVTTGPNAGFYHYDTVADEWVFDRPLYDTLARMTVTGGTADAVTATIGDGIAEASVIAFMIKPTLTNTGPLTINAKPVLNINGDPMSAGEFPAGRWITFTDEGASYQLTSDPAIDALLEQAIELAGETQGFRDEAEGFRDQAAGYAAGLNLPAISAGDRRKALRVNDAGSGYEVSNGFLRGIACRAVATSNVAIATSLENGDTVDGVVLVTGEAVLLVGQTDSKDNGVYVVSASGAASRHPDFDTWEDFPGAYFPINEGTANADTLWRCTSNKGGTLGTTPLVFEEFSTASTDGLGTLSPVYIEQLLTGFHGRGMLTAEAINIVTEQALAGTAGAGAVAIVVTTGSDFDAGGNVTVKHDNGRYWTYFITAISTNTLTIRPALRWPVSAAGGARVERTWYNRAHPGKFYMRQIAQRIALEKDWENCLPPRGRAFFTQFVSSGSLANDQLVAISGGVINYYDESSSNVATTNAPVRFAIGKTAFVDVASAGVGARTANFPISDLTDALVRIVVHCSRSDTVCTVRVVDDDARVNAEFVLPAATSQIPTVYTFPVRVHGDAKTLSVHFVGTTVPVAGGIIIDQVEVFGSPASGAAVLSGSAIVVGYGDSWVSGDVGSSAERESFLTQLQTELPDADIINEGIPGGTVFNLLANFDAAVASHHPTHVIVCTGVNDAYNPSSGTFDPTAIDQFTLAMVQLINRITGIGAKPIVLGIPALAEADGAFSTWDLNARAMKYSRNLYLALSSIGEPRGGWSNSAALAQFIVGRAASSIGTVNGKTLGEDALESSRSSAGSAGHFYFYNPNGQVGLISTSGSATTYATSSDEELKEFSGLYDPELAIDIIRQDPVRSFRWKADGSEAVGWGAQTSYSVSPDLAVPGEGAPGDDDFRPWGIDQGKRTPYLWAALGWAIDRIETLERRLAALEGDD